MFAERSSVFLVRHDACWRWLVRCALVCGLFLFWHFDHAPISTYVGFSKIVQPAECDAGERCFSEPIEVVGNVFEFEFRGDTQQVLSPLTIRRVRFGDSTAVAFPYTANQGVAGVWRRARVELPEAWLGSQVVIEWGGAQLEVRSRVNIFFQESISPKPWPVRIGIIGGLSLLFVVWFLLRPETYEWVGVSLIAVCTLFVRCGHYFYLDEWHILELFYRDGWSSLLLRHNEHLIPAFKLFYLIQVTGFGLSYGGMLFVSAVLHVLNGYLLLLIGNRLFPEAKWCVRAVVGLFLINALNVFNLSWAFQQSILLCGVSSLLASWAAVVYVVDRGKVRWLVSSLVATMLSPFFFGAGLMTGPKAVLITVSGALILRERCMGRMVALAIGTALVSGLSAALYFGGGSGVSGGELSQMLTSDIAHLLIRVGAFTGIGVFVGSLLRFIGVFPVASDEETILLILRYARPMLQGEVSNSAVLWLAVVGLMTALVALACLRTRKFQGIVPVATGILLVGMSLILPAIGRQHFGLLAAVMLRYHYLTADGIVLFFVPVAVYLVTLAGRGRMKWLMTAAAIGVVTLQLYHIERYQEFSDRANLLRSAIATQLEWRVSCDSGPKCEDRFRPSLSFQFPPHFDRDILLATYERIKSTNAIDNRR